MAVDVTGVQPTQGTQAPRGPDLRPDAGHFDDAFSKKPGDWAFNTFFLSSINPSQDIAGHRAVRPLDADVLDFVNLSVPPANRLPTGHLYTTALASTLSQLEADISNTRAKDVTPATIDALEILEKDVGLRDYLLTRQLEYYYG